MKTIPELILKNIRKISRVLTDMNPIDYLDHIHGNTFTKWEYNRRDDLISTETIYRKLIK